jgi:hypothetical protein
MIAASVLQRWFAAIDGSALEPFRPSATEAKGVFGSPVQPTKFYLDRDICKARCLLARLCSPGHCPLRTEKSSQPCPVEKLDSSFAGGQGRTRPRLFPAPHARAPRPAGVSDPEPSLPPSNFSLTHLSLWTPPPPELCRHPWSPPKLRRGPWSRPELRRRPW